MRVFDYIIVCKSPDFKNAFGIFDYRNIRQDLFFGTRQVEMAEGNFLMAEPEKAVVDFFYFNLRKFKTSAKAVFRDSYRFQNTEGLKPRKVLTWARVFNNRRLEAVAREFCAFIKEEKA